MSKSGVKLEFISDGFKEILLSGGTKELVQNATDNIAMQANANNTRGGNGFDSTVKVGGYGGGRWVGFVNATDKKAAIAEAEDKALSRAVR